jgi:hypothetical protein
MPPVGDLDGQRGVHRPARGDDTLDSQVGQLGNQGGESLKIARRA